MNEDKFVKIKDEKENDNDNPIFTIPDMEKLICKNCIKSCLAGPFAHTCVAYPNKPDEILFGGQDCPEFQQK